MSLLLCYGTRPEYLKIKPIIEECKSRSIPYKLLYIAQHTNIEATDKPNYTITVASADNRLDAIVGSIGTISDSMFAGVTSVLIQGDTATAFTCALAAFHRNKTILHLEAGLRTYDLKRPYPEEAYRQMISRIATVHLCPTSHAAANLRSEKIDTLTTVIGNTSLDNLRDVPITYQDEVLITMHRRENLQRIESWFTAFEDLASKHKQVRFTIPLHHNPGVTKYAHIFKNVNAVPAMSHAECIALIGKCKLVITDSGGIQEEASFLKKATIVCRRSTERTEGLGTHSFLCDTPNQLAELFGKYYGKIILDPSPYGDGYAARKLLNLLYNDKNSRIL